MNIILVIFDSLRQDHLGAYGNKWIQTPHFDGFAREAVTFSRCYPESLPTLQFRRAIHTGRRTFPFIGTRYYKGDVDPMPGWGPIPEEQDTLSEILGGQGYRSALISDAYHQFKASKNFHRGYDAYTFIRGQEADKYKSGPDIPDEVIEKHLNHASKDNEAIKGFLRKYLMNVSERNSEKDYFPAKVFEAASQWILENQNAQNLFMTIDSFDPHEPWDPPEYYRKLYDPDDDTVDHIQSLYSKWEGNISQRELKRMQANYAGEVTMCDRWFGHFMDALKLSGRLDDTVLAVVSDHGHNLGYDPGDKGYISKQGYPMTRGVCDLVFMVRHPSGENAGTICDKLIYNIDIPYTLLSLAGIDPTPEMQGLNVWPAVSDNSVATREYVTIAWGPAITVINDTWWYNANIWGDGKLLYDLRNDPGHENNLAQKHPQVCDQLHELARKDAGGAFPELLDKYREWPGCGLNAWGDAPYGTAARHAKWR